MFLPPHVPRRGREGELAVPKTVSVGKNTDQKRKTQKGPKLQYKRLFNIFFTLLFSKT